MSEMKGESTSTAVSNGLLTRTENVNPAIRTFFEAPPCSNLDELSANVAFLGIPFDSGVVGRPGTKFGPDAIRDADGYRYVNYQENTVASGYFDVDAGVERLKGITMADCGDVDIIPGGSDKNYERMTEIVRKVLQQGAFPVVVGGDHTITYPVVRAFDSYDSLDIVHFDSHIDFSDESKGNRIYHGSPLRRASELPFVRNITQIGIRSTRKKPYFEAMEYGVKVITLRKFKQLGVEQTVESIPQAENLYVTIDIDVLDPSIAPGTGTPVSGGLNYLELVLLLEGVIGRGKVVGFDLVEVSPPFDWAQLTSRVAATIMRDFLGAIFSSRPKK